MCHDLIFSFYYILSSPLFYLLISSVQPFSQLYSCFYCFVGSVSQAICVLLLFHSPFGWYLMGIFLKYWASSCNCLAHLSLFIDTLVPLCSLGIPESLSHWYCYPFGPLEYPPRPPVLSGLSPGELSSLLISNSDNNMCWDVTPLRGRWMSGFILFKVISSNPRSYHLTWAHVIEPVLSKFYP